MWGKINDGVKNFPKIECGEKCDKKLQSKKMC
jgi:hypothetical protein